MAGVAGLEPVTPAVTGQGSNQLRYTPAFGGSESRENSASSQWSIDSGTVSPKPLATRIRLGRREGLSTRVAAGTPREGTRPTKPKAGGQGAGGVQVRSCSLGHSGAWARPTHVRVIGLVAIALSLVA